MLKDNEIGQAYQFGNETTVKNIIEPNWWESDEQQADQQMYADEALRLAQERRRKEEENDGAEDEDMDDALRGQKTSQLKDDEGKSKVIARTRVSDLFGLAACLHS